LIRAVAAAVVGAFCASASFAQTTTPFAPPPPPARVVVKVLAPSQSFDPGVLSSFESDQGVEVVVDAPDASGKIRTLGYDLVLLDAADLMRAAAQGELSLLDRTRLRAGSAPIGVARKYALYGDLARLSLPYAWDELGIGYDHAAIAERLAGAPSWASLFQPDPQRLLLDCGLAFPDDRDALFFGAFRSLGVDPANATEMNARPAAFLVGKARKAARVFGPPDMAGVLATGGACIAPASRATLESARARAPKTGGPDLRFAIPPEGAAIMFDALAIPRDAAHPALAYALVDYLASAAVAARNAHASGWAGVFDPAAPVLSADLEPLSLGDPRVVAFIDLAWTSARVTEPPQLPPSRPRTAPPAAKAMPAR
jgi:putrescine transport system substrate-binding protein